MRVITRESPCGLQGRKLDLYDCDINFFWEHVHVVNFHKLAHAY